MFIIKENYTGNKVRSVQNKQELMKFIGQQAAELNYGIYRHWIQDGIAYFDCGPKTFYVDADVLQ